MKRGLAWKLNDNLKRKLFLKIELKKIILKSINYNSKLPLAYRYYSFYQYSKINKWATLVQQKNKCVNTGRVWSTEKLTKYSRFIFRRESYQGNIPGFSRANW